MSSRAGYNPLVVGARGMRGDEARFLASLDMSHNRLDRQAMDVSKDCQLEMQLQFRLNRETSAACLCEVKVDWIVSIRLIRWQCLVSANGSERQAPLVKMYCFLTIVALFVQFICSNRTLFVLMVKPDR